MQDIYHLGVKGLIHKENKVLLLEVDTSELASHEDPHWDIPGGRVEKGDTIENTLKKEIHEEIGVDEISIIKPFGIYLSNMRIPVGNSNAGLILAIYECAIGNTENLTLSKEHLSANWFNYSEAATLLRYKYPKELTDKLISK